LTAPASARTNRPGVQPGRVPTVRVNVSCGTKTKLGGGQNMTPVISFPKNYYRMLTAKTSKPRKPFFEFWYIDIHFSEFLWSKDTPYFTRKAIGVALGYPAPENAVDNMLRKVPALPTSLEVTTTDHAGKKCKEKLYDLAGVLLIASHANTHLAPFVITNACMLLNLWHGGEFEEYAKSKKFIQAKKTK
jgi:hypothetical protein